MTLKNSNIESQKFSYFLNYFQHLKIKIIRIFVQLSWKPWKMLLGLNQIISRSCTNNIINSGAFKLTSDL